MLQCTVEHQGTVADSFFIKKGGSSKKGPQSGRQPIPAITVYIYWVSKLLASVFFFDESD